MSSPFAKFSYWVIALILMQTLTACQYFTFYQKALDPNWANADTNPESMCEAMGADRNTASLDWCAHSMENNQGVYPQQASNYEYYYNGF